MVRVRKSAARGFFDHGWLKTFHTFSFAEYQDPRFMGFRSLRVINEDFVAPAAGFPTHSHRDMEIVTYLLSGALEHKDSMGNTSVIRPGDAQRMTAGTGVTHSEFNASKTQPVHLLQIWIFPERKALTPGYEQKSFGPFGGPSALRLLASSDGREGSVHIHQNAAIHEGRSDGRLQIEFRPGRGAGVWVQVHTGELTVNGSRLEAGDGAAVEEEAVLRLEGRPGAGFLLFELGD